jgi:hypothetical protein
MPVLASALAGVVLVTAPAGVLSLTATPAAYDGAAAHQSYRITIDSRSPDAMVIHSTLAPDVNCGIELTRRPSWAAMSGPASFTLRPHASRSFTVSVGQPPPGKSELVAAFIASDPSKTAGVRTSAGVGTALRFSEPGRTVITPCPKPKSSGNPKIRTVYVGASKPAATGLTPLLLGGFGGGILAAALASGLMFIIRRRRSQ